MSLLVKITRNDLVQIDAHQQQFRFQKYDKALIRNTVLALPTNPEIRRKVEMANEILERHGVTKVCAACWRGELRNKTGGVGCCQGCALSGPKSCLRKPISCATWLCSYATRLFPEAVKELRILRNSIDSSVSHPQGITSFRYNSLVSESRLK